MVEAELKGWQPECWTLQSAYDPTELGQQRKAMRVDGQEELMGAWALRALGLKSAL